MIEWREREGNRIFGKVDNTVLTIYAAGCRADMYIGLNKDDFRTLQTYVHDGSPSGEFEAIQKCKVLAEWLFAEPAEKIDKQVWVVFTLPQKKFKFFKSKENAENYLDNQPNSTHYVTIMDTED